eukprot:478607_1
MLTSPLRSCVYALICFIPKKSSIMMKENEWLQQYGKDIVNGLSESLKITDRAILGDCCDGFSIMYVLRYYNHMIGAICVNNLKSLYNNGQYYVVKKHARK